MFGWISDIEDYIQALTALIFLSLIGTALFAVTFEVDTLVTRWITVPIEDRPSILTILTYTFLLILTPIASGFIRSARRKATETDVSTNLW